MSRVMSRKRTIADLAQDEYRVHMIRSLVHMPKRDEATKLLQQLVNHTRILLKRKQWKVGLLCEFYPKNKQLLGLNMNSGSKIMIRLRDANDNNRFLPYESLLGTMIHELVHIKIHAHSYDFYKMVEDLSIEVQTDMISSEYREYTTEMEFGKGQILGGNTLASRKKDAKELIREATLRRNQTSDHENGNSSSVEGRRLGGDADSLHTLTPRELRLQAVERRLKITSTVSFAKPIIPEKQVYSPQSEFTCGDAMSQEDFDFIMANTQDVPIIDLVNDDDDYKDDYLREEDNFNENKPLLKTKLTMKERKDDENSLLVEDMLTQEFCAPCSPSMRNQTINPVRNVVKRKKSNIPSTSKVEVIVLDDDDNENEKKKVKEQVNHNLEYAQEQWKCQICLEENCSILSRCSWCGLER